MKSLALVVSSCVFLAMFAEATTANLGNIGWREVGGVNVDSDATLTVEEPLPARSGATFLKTGAGTLELPTAALDGKAKHIAVEGTTKLTRTAVAASAYAVPSFVTTDAKLWLDASKAASVVLDNNVVTNWYDAREESADYSAPKYFYCSTREISGGTHVNFTYGDVTLVDSVTRKGIYFGGKVTNSGTYMQFCTNDNGTVKTAEIPAVYNAFIVHGINKIWGNLIGYKANPSLPTASCFLDGIDVCTGHFYDRGVLLSGAYVARYYLNTANIDAYCVPPQKGFQLLECDFCEYGHPWDSLFVQRREIGRCGGDYISEIIAFDRRLTEAERVEVETYLMRKWQLKGPTDTPELGVAANASVEVESASDELISSYGVALNGEGTLVKKGASRLTLDSTALYDFNGTFRLLAGSVLARGFSNLPIIEAEKGVVYTTSESTSITESNYGNSGVTLSVAAGADADALVKNGNSDITVATLPSGLKKLQVNGGTFKIRGTASEANRYEASAPVSVTITNADFEQEFNFGANPNMGRGYWTGDTKNGWTIPTGSPSGRSGFTVCTNSAYWSGPEFGGKQALFLMQSDDGKELSSIYTTANFPVAGEYDISWAESAYNNVMMPYEFRFGPESDEWDNAEVVARRTVLLTAFSRTHVRVKVTTPGNHLLGFKSVLKRESGDHAMTVVDNIRADFVPVKRTRTVAIPNGDFELTSNNMSGYTEYDLAPVEKNDPSTNNQARCWTITPGSATGYKRAAVMIASPSSPRVKRREYATGLARYANLASVDHGSVVLLMASKKGEATGGKAETDAFTVPAGTYRLRGRLASHKIDWYGDREDIPPIFKATVKVGGASTVLGSLTVANHDFQTYIWDTPFTLDEESQVSICLEQVANASTMGAVDDLELIADDAFVAEDSKELVKNGSFEADLKTTGVPASPWVTVVGAQANDSTTVFRPTDVYTDGNGQKQKQGGQYGWVPYDGQVYVNVRGSAKLRQNLGRLDRGRYRFRYAAHSRNSGVDYANNPLKVLLTNTVTGASVDIATTTVSKGVPQLYTYEFDLPTTGEYTLSIEGQDDTTKRCTLVDAVSLRRIPVAASVSQPTIGSSDLEVELTSGSTLSYDGDMTVKRFKADGIAYFGTLTSENCPALTGSGKVTVVDPPQGLTIMIR